MKLQKILKVLVILRRLRTISIASERFLHNMKFKKLDPPIKYQARRANGEFGDQSSQPHLSQGVSS
jgi:hypothetical protein